MVDALKSPQPGFADAARAHFYYKRHELRAQVAQWLGEMAAVARHELRLRCAGAATAAALELTVQNELLHGTAKLTAASGGGIYYEQGLSADRVTGLSPRALSLRSLLANVRNVVSSWSPAATYSGGGAVPPPLALKEATVEAAAAASVPPVRTVAWTRNATALQQAASYVHYSSSSSQSTAAAAAAAGSSPARLLPPPPGVGGARGPNPLFHTLDAIQPFSLAAAGTDAQFALDGGVGEARALAAAAALMSAVSSLPVQPPESDNLLAVDSALTLFCRVTAMARSPTKLLLASGLFIAAAHAMVGLLQREEAAAEAAVEPTSTTGAAAAAPAGKAARAASGTKGGAPARSTSKGGGGNSTSASAGSASKGAGAGAAASSFSSAAAATAAAQNVTIRYEPPAQLTALFADAAASVTTAAAAAASSAPSASSAAPAAAAAGSGPCTALMHRLLDPMRRAHAGAVEVLTAFGVSPNTAPGTLTLGSSAATLLLAFNTAAAADELFRLLAGLEPPAPPSGDDDEGL
jgi:hypothetical protein